jgi:hypothetical protein
LRKAETNGKHKDTDTVEITQAVSVDSLGQLDDIEQYENAMLSLHLGENINIDQFQGDLFRWLVKSKGKVSEIVLPGEIPATSHFANICLHLGITVRQSN